MLTEEAAREQLQTLHREGSALAEEFITEQRERRKLYGEERKSEKALVVVIRSFEEREQKRKRKEKGPEPPPPAKTQFEERYQSWYRRALPLMKQVAPESHTEFQTFYVLERKYHRGSRPYVIQDYFRGRGADDAAGKTARCFKNQLAILKAVLDRLAWGQMDTHEQIERGLELGFLDTARKLMDTNHIAAGALAGTVLEGYLKKLAAKYKLKFRKQTPPLREFIDALHAAKAFDIPVHSQATWLAEIADRSRAEGEAPTKLQVRDLIDGCHWLITNVF